MKNIDCDIQRSMQRLWRYVAVLLILASTAHAAPSYAYNEPLLPLILQMPANGWGSYAGWADGTSGAFPDWLQVNFAGSRSIDKVVVCSVQDNYLNPLEPTDTMTGMRFVLTSLQVQEWNGSGWITLASVSGNNLIKRTVSFNAYTTDRIRVVAGTQDGVWSRITVHAVRDERSTDCDQRHSGWRVVAPNGSRRLGRVARDLPGGKHRGDGCQASRNLHRRSKA